MNDVININVIKDIVSCYIYDLNLKLLQKMINEEPIMIRKGTWIERSNIVLGNISINPHNDRDEDVLEFRIFIELERKIKVEMDISWSDGEIVKKFPNYYFPLSINENGFNELKSYLDKGTNEVINEIVGLLEKNLPPRFHDH
jgi:hypothetical protein